MGGHGTGGHRREGGRKGRERVFLLSQSEGEWRTLGEDPSLVSKRYTGTGRLRYRQTKKERERESKSKRVRSSLNST